jgi:hypothetical protein
MPDIISTIIARGDLGHLALFLWASGSSFLTMTLVRELTSANRRFDTFVRELARFNNHISEEEEKDNDFFQATILKPNILKR